MAKEPKHRIEVTCEGQFVGGWSEYTIETNMIEPADAFSMRRPMDAKSWELLRRDARIRVFIDGAPVLDGFVDDRFKRTKEGTMEIAGRDRVGRLVQESAPRINYQGLDIVEAVRRLADPWFPKVSLTDARNRRLRMGKNKGRIPAGNEPIIVKRSSSGAGRVQPGTMRWAVIEEIVSQAGMMCWSSADGTELFLGRPNYNQAPTFAVYNCKPGSPLRTTVRDLIIGESNGDRYSLIACVGTGGGTEKDFGISVSSRRAVSTDGDNADGTGRDFLYPKRLLLPEKNFDSNQDAAEIALRESIRREFKRTSYSADMMYHGQWITPVGATIFAPNTVAAIHDEDFDPIYTDDALIYGCTYKRNRDDGESTLLEMIPTTTEIVL